MARGKKKEQLSLEEKLEQALVPAGEQPYQVPGNWCWIHLLNAFDNVTDSKKKLTTKEYSAVGEYPIIDQGQEFIGGYTDNEDVVHESNLPIVIFGDHTRCVKYIDFRFVQGADGVKVLKPKSFWNAKAFCYAFQAIEIPNVGYRRHYPLFKNFCIPVPPLAEQQRIVDRIERMFAQLDEAKEKVQYVRNCCDDNFASAVHEALTGNLTERWRLQKGISKSEWKKDKLGNLGILERGRSKHRPRNDSRLFGGAYPFIQTGDVAEANVFIKKHKQTLSEFGLEQSKMFAKGTLCITIAANIGDTAILSYDCCFPDSVVGFTPYKNVESKFVYYMMNELQKEIEANAPAQKNINLRILKDIDMIIPPISEQKKIIAILDELFDKKMKIKTKTEETVDAINRIKKLILVKAFRGQLGTNHPEEESAMELLKSILMES